MSLHRIDIARVDLNLLGVFEALIEERQVVRAAARLSLSQSATSHALSRLREAFGDPLFVRNPRGIEPTPRARELAVPIADALSRLRVIFSPQAEFDPAQLRRTFTVAASDYSLSVLWPAVMADLHRQAPGVDVRCVALDASEVIKRLDRGELDLAIGGLVEVGAARVTRTPLFTDRFVGVARHDHPGLRKGRMSLKAFLATPHVLVSASGGLRDDVDDALAALGKQRRIAMTTQSFLALPFVVGSTGMIGVLPERLALRSAKAASLSVFELPLTMKPVACSTLSLTPLLEQPETRWLLGILKKAASAQ